LQSYGWQNLPGLLFGLLTLLAAMLSLCLPETKDVPLPQTIDEGEKLAGNLVIGQIFRSVYRRTPGHELHDLLIYRAN